MTFSDRLADSLDEVRRKGQFIVATSRLGGRFGGEFFPAKDGHVRRGGRLELGDEIGAVDRLIERDDEKIIPAGDTHGARARERENGMRVKALRITQCQARPDGCPLAAAHHIMMRAKSQIAIDGQPYGPSLRQLCVLSISACWLEASSDRPPVDPPSRKPA